MNNFNSTFNSVMATIPSRSNNSNLLNSLSSSISTIQSNFSSLSNFVNDNVVAKPLNIFPNYWIMETGFGPNVNIPTIKIPVEKGKTYNLSFMISSSGDRAKVPLRANSEWNIADQWGDIIKNDGGANGDKSIYNIKFTAPRTGNMPIEFIFTNKGKAMASGNSNIMIQRITMTQTDNYVPYEKCNNKKQSLADITGKSGGMTAKEMFGTL